MDITHIEHIGIAVRNIEEQLPYYEDVLGLKCYNIETVEDQKVKTAFFKVGQTKIELLEPTSEDSTIAKFIERRGEGVHHIAFATEKLQENLDELIAVGNQLLVFETNNLVGTQTKISLDEFLDKLYKKIYSGCIEYNKNRYCKK